MFKTKFVSSQIKAFIDDKIDSFQEFSKGSALLGEKYSFQLLYVDEGESEIPSRPLCSYKLEGDLAPFITIRDVRNVPVDHPFHEDFGYDSQYLRTTPGIYPDILTPLRYNGQVVIGKDKLRALWFEVDIPEDFKGSGKLKFSLYLSSASIGDTANVVFEDQPPLSVNEIEIELISVNLPEQKLLFTQWFYPDCLASYYNVEVWSDRHFEIVENFLRGYAARGRNMVYTPILTPALNVLPPFYRNPCQLVDVRVDNGVYSFGFTNLDKWIDILDRVGIKYIEISHLFDQKIDRSAKVYATVDGEYKLLFGWETLGLSDEYITFVQQMLTATLEHLKKRGDDKRCYFHISDEPTAKTLGRYLKEKEAIAEIIKGYPVMDALSNIEFYESGAVEIPVPCTSHAYPFIEKGIDELWVYYACNQVIGYSNCYLSMPSWRTRSLGMQIFKYNLQGFLHWGYNYYNNRASGDAINPYLDLGGEDWVCAGDTFIVYPDSDGNALESIRSMTMEEAMQDIRAMQLCEKYYSHEEVVKAMEEELGAEITFERCAHTEEEMLKVRERINKMIAEKIK